MKSVDSNDVYAPMRHSLVHPGTQNLDAGQTSLGGQFQTSGLFSQGASKSKIFFWSLITSIFTLIFEVSQYFNLNLLNRCFEILDSHTACLLEFRINYCNLLKIC